MKDKSHKDFRESLKLIAGNLKKERIAQGITQEKLAEINNIDYKYYQRIEAGDVNITMKTLCKLSESLKIDPVKLFAKEE
jgi:transcriptional regulator with XRE-family HTH domain